MPRPLFQKLLWTGCIVIVLAAVGGRWLGAHLWMDQRALIWGLGMGLVLVLGLGLWFSHRITRPIARITRMARAVAEGRLDERAPEASIAEVNQLGQALNALAQSVEHHLTALRAERNRATAIIESMAEGVVALDAQGRVLLMNASAGSFVGTNAEQARGKPLMDVFRHHELDELIRQVRSDQRPAIREWTVFQPTERIHRAHVIPCETSQPTGPSIVVVIQDLTELRDYEQLRRRFVANVSHELKTPLTAIRGLTEALLDGALEDAANNRRFLGLVDEEARRLSRLIDDLLELSRIETHEAVLKLESVDLKALVQALLPAFEPELISRRLTLTTRIDDRARLSADPDRLRQVFINLIDNAIKYNREGGEVTISAKLEDSVLRVTVADTGIGIPTEDLPRIFERFYRADKARSRESGGTGLGLSIVKHIVESHDGQVHVESEPGRGSIFSITLPLGA